MLVEDPSQCPVPMLQTRGRGVKLGEPMKDVWAAMLHSFKNEAFRGEGDDDDASHGWAIITTVRQKQVMTRLPGTKKMIVYMGSKDSRRGAVRSVARGDNTNQRAIKHPHAAWARQLNRGRAGKGGKGS